jgi:hypothetical protein
MVNDCGCGKMFNLVQKGTRTRTINMQSPLAFPNHLVIWKMTTGRGATGIFQKTKLENVRDPYRER